MVSWTLFRLRGAPVRLHWSAPLGVYAFSGFRFEPVYLLASLGLVLLHEVGHALVVRAAGGRVVELELNGLGGYCRWQGEVSPIGRAAIAFGGVWAQLALLFAALALAPTGVFDGSYPGRVLFWTATVGNVWMVLLNLVPLRPLDGAEAWRLPLLLGRAARRGLSARRDMRHVPHVVRAEEGVAPGAGASTGAGALVGTAESRGAGVPDGADARRASGDDTAAPDELEAGTPEVEAAKRLADELLKGARTGEEP